MDNVTHTLTGLALSRAGLNIHVPRATFLLIVAANIPDIDMITLFEGRLRNLEIHRGYSHALIGLPFMAVISVLLTALVFRSRLPWFTAWLVSCVGVASHLLLDWSMTYGVRLLLPFSSSWYYLDIFNLIDWLSWRCCCSAGSRRCWVILSAAKSAANARQVVASRSSR